MRRLDAAHVVLAIGVIVLGTGWYASTRLGTEARGERDETTIVRTVQVNGAPMSVHCAGYRTAVKYGVDSNAGSMNLKPVSTNMGYLTGLPHPPKVTSDTPRLAPLETQVWELHPYLLSFQLEPDQDYHLRLQDTSGRTMVAELPSPLCTPKGSRIASQIAVARQQFVHLFGNAAQGRPSIRVHITGLGFWDFPHGGLDTAANGVELHPVLNISLDQAPNPILTHRGTGHRKH